MSNRVVAVRMGMGLEHRFRVLMRVMLIVEVQVVVLQGFVRMNMCVVFANQQ